MDQLGQSEMHNLDKQVFFYKLYQGIIFSYPLLWGLGGGDMIDQRTELK